MSGWVGGVCVCVSNSTVQLHTVLCCLCADSFLLDDVSTKHPDCVGIAMVSMYNQHTQTDLNHSHPLTITISEAILFHNSDQR